MRTLDARGLPMEAAARELARDSQSLDKAFAVAREIIDQVGRKGDEALLDLTERLDGVRPPRLLLDREEMEAALSRIPDRLRDALRFAARQIESFHRPQVPVGYEVPIAGGGSVAGQQPRALERVGVYVPGGPAGYPSSVLMGVIPAKLAGVRDVLVATPPARNEGMPPDAVLASAALAGADRVLVAGGAQAVAAMALGTETIHPVEKIVGPGNVYVTAAKLLLSGQVATDGIAGPSEVLVIADRTLSTDAFAAELVAQAEHDPEAVAIGVVTDDRDLEGMLETTEALAQALPRSAEILAALERNGRLVRVPSLEYAIELANRLAPEHLVLAVRDARAYAYAVRNAGCVFCGPSTTAPIGDYIAGTNHILPTAGSARWRGALSVRDFVKFLSYVELSARDVPGITMPAREIARAEGFLAHEAALVSRSSGKAEGAP